MMNDKQPATCMQKNKRKEKHVQKLNGIGYDVLCVVYKTISQKKQQLN